MIPIDLNYYAKIKLKNKIVNICSISFIFYKLIILYVNIFFIEPHKMFRLGTRMKYILKS